MSCITLLSDFGLQDASVANAKSILSRYGNLPVFDISHQVEPYHLQQAAYLLSTAYKNFPVGTCHIILLDIFSEKVPRLLLCQKEDQFFLAPDNGILSLAFKSNPEKVWNCFDLQSHHKFSDWLHEAGKIIQSLQTNSPESLELVVCDLKNAPLHWRPRVEQNILEGHVIHIDRYENVVSNISKEKFEEVGEGKPFRILFLREEIKEISNHYNAVKEGEKLCRFNEAGYLEIAINHGNAAGLFGLRLRSFKEQHMIYNTIKIIFG